MIHTIRIAFTSGPAKMAGPAKDAETEGSFC